MFLCTTAVEILAISLHLDETGECLPRFRKPLIGPDQCSHIFSHLSRGFAFRLRFQEIVDDLEYPSLRIQIGRGKKSVHPFDRFVPQDQGWMSLKQAPKGETRGVLEDSIV